MGISVLIVDDSAMIRSIVKRSIGLSGIPVERIREAPNGAVALGLVLEAPAQVDVIFTDINMPEMNGVDFLQKLHEQGVLARIPTVIISSESQEMYGERLAAMGVRSFLSKPFHPDKVREVVTEALRQAGKSGAIDAG